MPNTENVVLCNCMNVTLFDVEDAMHSLPTFPDVEKQFEEVQQMTGCSTGCGGCHDKIMDTIADIMSK
ncbi:MAG: (2Fe-2S)-binding protein [Oscillospiraceae bacterium]|nr:(2Fe-2S)-binding protein [Oscillospiraceae bacterium]